MTCHATRHPSSETFLQHMYSCPLSCIYILRLYIFLLATICTGLMENSSMPHAPAYWRSKHVRDLMLKYDPNSNTSNAWISGRSMIRVMPISRFVSVLENLFVLVVIFFIDPSLCLPYYGCIWPKRSIASSFNSLVILLTIVQHVVNQQDGQIHCPWSTKVWHHIKLLSLPWGTTCKCTLWF